MSFLTDVVKLELAVMLADLVVAGIVAALGISLPVDAVVVAGLVAVILVGIALDAVDSNWHITKHVEKDAKEFEKWTDKELHDAWRWISG